MTEFEFDRLLRRYLAGTITPEEKELLERWVESLPEDDNVDPGWSVEDHDSMLRRINSKIDTREERETPVRKINPRVWKIAASILVLALVVYGIGRYRNPGLPSVIAVNTIRKQMLPDGSIVWLKNGATVDTENFAVDHRQLALRGEALFEVAKDAAHPFVIESSGIVATVLGTSFNIRPSSEKIEVVVLTGKVKVQSGKEGKAVVLNAHQQGEFAPLHEPILTEVTEAQKLNLQRDTEYNMAFTQAPLREVVKRIGKKFNVTIWLDNPEMNMCSLTADFTDQSLEHTLTMMSAVFEMDYSIEGDTVVLTGGKCR